MLRELQPIMTFGNCFVSLGFSNNDREFTNGMIY